MADSDFEFHRRWVEELFQTPSPHARFKDAFTEQVSPTEHVLRGSRSFAARSLRSRLSELRQPSERSNNENASVRSHDATVAQGFVDRPLLGEIADNSQVRIIPGHLRPSPTPSLKRKKAEAIVKAHGSPTHVRVTAGGRIVPSEQSPLCFPRFGYSAIKANGGLIKLAPNHQVGKAQQWTRTVQDGSQNGFVAQDVEGRLYQIVNGNIMPLSEVNGALQLYMPAPNLNITHRGIGTGTMPGSEMHQQEPQSLSAPIPVANPLSVTAQIQALELEYTKRDHELKDLDRTEVIHGKSMGKAAKEALVAKRRELVISMDKVRKTIKALKEHPAPSTARPQTPTFGQQAERSMSPVNSTPRGTQYNVQPAYIQAQAPFYGMPPFLPGPSPFGSGNVPGTEGGFVTSPYMLPPAGFFTSPPPFDGPVGWMPSFQPFPPFNDAAAQHVQFEEIQQSAVSVPQTDGAASTVDRPSSPRHSHALPLHDPDTKQVINIKSALNPMSPVYKPHLDGADSSSRGSGSAPKTVRDRPPTPLSFSHLAKTDGISAQSRSQHRTQHTTTASSGSSIRTLDFFPNNARDHSMRKHEYPLPAGKKENTTPGESTRSGSDDSGQKLDTAHHNTDWNPDIPARTFSKQYEQDENALKVPPGTPTAYAKVYRQSGVHSEQIGHRHAHFQSRKLQSSPIDSRRETARGNDGASSEAGLDRRSAEHDVSIIDFSNKPRSWIEGYQAGLNHKAVSADSDGYFLDGYCSGLLKFQPSQVPQKLQPAQDERQVSAQRQASRSVPPAELAKRSLDCLKEAVISPSNENAILTPSTNGPSVTNTIGNLGAWQKEHEFYMSAQGQGLSGYEFFDRVASAKAPDMLRVDSLQENEARPLGATSPFEDNTETSHEDTPRQKTTGNSYAPGPAIASRIEAAKVSTAQKSRPSIASGKRIISPLEWRTRNSLANVANMTSPLFSHGQVDGQPGDRTSSYNDREPMLASASEMSGSGLHASRFRESSLDGLSPPVSPEPISRHMSPPVSPRSSPMKLFGDKRISGKHSPTKTKFEHIASKVGIKHSPEKVSSNDLATSPGKNRWKDLWKGARTASGKHDMA